MNPETLIIIELSLFVLWVVVVRIEEWYYRKKEGKN